MKSKVNILEIIEKHFSTLKNKNGNLLKSDRKYFFIYPILFGLVFVFIIGIPNEKLINFFTLSLSVFIGLFLNLLVLIISFAENKLKISDSENRKKLLQQTFYNITYTIIISLIGLGLLLIANISLFPKEWCVDFSQISNRYFQLKETSINRIFELIFYYAFYTVFIHIIMTLLMIIKRIFKLFNAEIDETNKKKE